MHYLPDPTGAARLNTEQLRNTFLVRELFVAGTIALRLVDLDRVVLGGVVPLATPISLPTPDALRAQFFCERRELGVLNIGGAGTVTVDGAPFSLATKDVLYVGRGSKAVTFTSAKAATPARFYLVSYPAHATYPTALATAADTHATVLGTPATSNHRTVRRYIHAAGVRSAQLVMGVTTLEPGSVWNTMPTHTHDRRTEVYLYFGVPRDAMVVHLLGEPQETRHVIVRDAEVALSPGWSIHSGCGTSAYSFCWAMGG
ncbi:MAG: 5-dehydro-4-deoxy-D-glucuronate isomerase, partial [Gemmatimonas sp.]